MNGDLAVRQIPRNLVDFALQRGVKDRVERPVQVLLQEQPDDRMRRHQVDLEFALRRHSALRFQRGEVGIGASGDVGIEQIVEAHIGDRLAGSQAIARVGAGTGMDAEDFIRFLKRGIVGEDRLQPGDPVAALAGLAIGNALEVRPERAAHFGEDLAGVGQRYATDKMDVARHFQSQSR